jgi:hypothetical protein
MGGDSSPYKININGTPTYELQQIELAANDSIYVFVTVTIHPNATDIPFLVKDSILFNWNGNTKFVQLEAYGQNAHYIRDGNIITDTTWTADLPFVIIGGLTIEPSASLTLEAGCKLFFHADAALQISGRMIASGTSINPVVFSGDRLDEYYRNLPGSWPGMSFSSSSQGNRLSYSLIKNAYRAIDSKEGAELWLKQCLIDNAWDAGIYSNNSSILAENCLISNCGKNIRLMKGGNYDFIHCTLASYSTDYLFHQYPVAEISDADIESGISGTSPLTANFTNCIFWGETGMVDNEIITNKRGNNFEMNLMNCLIRASTDPTNVMFTGVIRNQDPKFDSIDRGNGYFDFHTNNFPDAAGIDKGIATPLLVDLDGENRNNGLPDLGCYEKQ